jgi:tetratricopeptide (TPR) repeat protein
MIRFGRLSLVLALILLLPGVAAAQKDTKFTKEASKFLGLAMAKQNPAERTQLYEQAMVHLRQGQTEDAANAKVWLLSGTVLAALGNLPEADAAFKKAVELHPEYAEEIEGEREAAWIESFNAGLAKMDAKDYAGAIQLLEGAQQLYAKRPEGLMNLGAMYASGAVCNELPQAEQAACRTAQMAKSEQAFKTAIEATKGPLFEKLDEEGKASWLRFRDMATLNLAQMAGARGVEHFEAQRFEEAAKAFKEAADINPHARDYWFNLMQSHWAMAAALEEKMTAAPAAEQPALKQQLIPVYQEVIRLVQKTREMDPNSEVLYVIEARSERMIGEYSGAPDRVKQGQDKALALLQQHQALGVDVSEIQVQGGEGGATVTGKLKSRTLDAGKPVTLTFTFLGIDGKVLGTQDVAVTTAAKETDQPFELKAPSVTGEVAGWKYVVKT